MKLFLGLENRIAYSQKFDNNDSWEITGDVTVGDTVIAPDGSSLAYQYHTDGAGWDAVSTKTTAVPIESNNGYAYISSFYAKPMSDTIIKFYSLFDEIGSSKAWASVGYFSGLDLVLYNSHETTDHYGVINYGKEAVGGGWFKLWAVHDLRNSSLDATYPVSWRIYPNAPGGLGAQTGLALWGASLERTKLRNVPSSYRNGDGTSIFTTDFRCIDFTQLPSNLSEIDNDVFKDEKTIDGSVARYQTNVESSVKKLVWDAINYKKHGQMLYFMREAVADKYKRDCVLEYPSEIKRHYRSATIRPVNFSFEYLDKKDMAKVELDYYIINQYKY